MADESDLPPVTPAAPPPAQPWRWPSRSKAPAPVPVSPRDPVANLAQWRAAQLPDIKKLGEETAAWDWRTQARPSGPETAKLDESMATGGPIGVGAIRHVKAPFAGKTPGTIHRFEWAPSEQQLARPPQPELTLSGSTYHTNPEELQDIMFGAAPTPGSAGREMTKIGWEKLNQFYRELHDLFQKHGITKGSFLPAEGQMSGRGPNVRAEARKRAFERMAGSKAEKVMEESAEGPFHTGDYTIDFGPPKLGPPAPEAATAPTSEPKVPKPPPTEGAVWREVRPGLTTLGAGRRPVAARRSPTTEVRRPTPEELQAAKDQMNADARNAAMHAQIDATQQRFADARARAAPPVPSDAERAAIARAEQLHGLRLSPPSALRRTD